MFTDVNEQLYGASDFPLDNSRLPDNSGFAWVFKKQTGASPQEIMNIYTPQ